MHALQVGGRASIVALHCLLSSGGSDPCLLCLLSEKTKTNFDGFPSSIINEWEIVEREACYAKGNYWNNLLIQKNYLGGDLQVNSSPSHTLKL